MKERIHKVVLNALIIFLVGALYTGIVLTVGNGIPCVFHLITGMKCPGCGISRMLLSIMKLDFAAAFGYNQAVFCLLPVMLFVIVRKTYLYISRGSSKDKIADIIDYVMIAVLLIFGVVRNIVIK